MLSNSDVLIVFLDLQDALVRSSQTNSEKALRKSVRALAQIAKLLTIPAIASAVPMGPRDPGVIREILEELPEISILVRNGPSAIENEKTSEKIGTFGRKTLAICGVMSEVVVLRTAIGARKAGYDVQVLLDASGGFSDRTEAAAIRQMEAAGAITTSVASFATEMVTDFSTEQGGGVLTAVRSILG